MIGLLDIDMGNLKSIGNAVLNCGFDPKTVASSNQFDDLTHLILPGVGAFGAAMRNILESGLEESILAFVESGRPLLGICLGMQILSETGDENSETRGLSLIAGRVSRFPEVGSLRIPHVGWNDISIHVQHPIFSDLRSGVDFYFVHSYRFTRTKDNEVYASAEYGSQFPAIVGRGNVVGVQFHPEKSQTNGLMLLENFLNWDGKC